MASPTATANPNEFTIEQLRILTIYEMISGHQQHGDDRLYRQHKDPANVHAGSTFKLAKRPDPHNPSKTLPEQHVLTVTPQGIQVHHDSVQAMEDAIQLSIKMYNGNFKAQNVSIAQEQQILAFVIEGLAHGTLTDGNIDATTGKGNVLEEITFNGKTYTKAQAQAMLAAQTTSTPAAAPVAAAAPAAPVPPLPTAPARGPSAGSRPVTPTPRGAGAAPPLTATRPSAATGTTGLKAETRPASSYRPK
jgi:hypothetical protein